MKTNFTRGVFYACLAAMWWGMPQPLFFNEIKFIPSLEVAMHRGVWSFFVLFLSLLFLNNIYDFFKLFKSLKNIIILTITSLLIATNWLGFIYSVSIDKVQDASLGYFLTPLISISLGYLILKEKLNLRKIISVLLMLVACFILFTTLDKFPFLALLIGTTWGVYGLLRKQIQISPAIGLLFESGLISLFALPYLIYLSYENISFFSLDFSYISIMLFFTGIVTIIPLFFFNLGLRHTTLGLAGVLFYIAPSFHFITSVFILDEYMEVQKFIAFIVIWIAVFIFIYDAVNTSRLSRIKLNN
ncbi:EamA family transporter [Pelagibacterales bacterium SAG-MED31]|nr:EamA family transporter [Pelagibacterales bacterium SAG-MED31]